MTKANLTLEDIEQARQLVQKAIGDEPIVNGVVVSMRIADHLIRSAKSEEKSVIPFIGHGVQACMHLQDDEYYVARGKLMAWDLVGFINLCESIGIRWRSLLAMHGVKRGS